DGRGKRRMTLLMHSILNGKTYTSRYAEDCATDRRSLAALGMTWGVTAGIRIIALEATNGYFSCLTQLLTAIGVGS
ncbi:MAG: hypothetical protein NTW08_05600, partial [Gammaproteobacteria bacterium]|nr:hypothetical protein [Gammaproteobacteria bacterium]